MKLDERVLHRIRLRELRVFLTVCELGGMGHAAKRLGMSQPAVSKAIKELETTLAIQLFDRAVRGVEPNAYGRALLARAPALFDELRQAIKAIKAVDDPTSGEVRISSTEPMTAGFVPAVIERVTRKYPRLTFTVSQATTIAGQYDELRERKVDLILGRTILSKADERDLLSEALLDDRLLVVVGQRHPLARRRVVDIAELAGELVVRARLSGIVCRRACGESVCVSRHHAPAAGRAFDIDPAVCCAARKRPVRQRVVAIRRDAERPPSGLAGVEDRPRTRQRAGGTGDAQGQGDHRAGAAVHPGRARGRKEPCDVAAGCGLVRRSMRVFCAMLEWGAAPATQAAPAFRNIPQLPLLPASMIGPKPTQRSPSNFIICSCLFSR